MSTLFDLVPEELFLQTLHYCDCKTFLRLSDCSRKNKYLKLAQEKVGYLTGLRCNEFDFKRLEEVCGVRITRNISASLSPLVTTMNGQVYILDDDINQLSDVSNVIQMDHSLLLTSKGEVYLSGNDNKDITPKSTDIVYFSAGTKHTLLLASNGNIYGFGDGRDGQLGFSDGKLDNPTLIPVLSNIIQVAAGYNHTLVLNAKGKVKVFGDNKYGQLGIGNVDSFVIDPNLKINNVVQIAAGKHLSLLLTSDKKVYSFGRNRFGQLGLGLQEDICISTPTLIPTLNNIIQVSIGFSHCLFLTENGKVYSVGKNIYGQLGLGYSCHSVSIHNLIHELNDIVSISAGLDYSLALDIKGNVYIFGRTLHNWNFVNLNVPTHIYTIPKFLPPQ